MREKLLQLMKSEGLSSSRLAELLEAQPSSISHLLSGRNKPSFDLIQKILRRFPRINPDWLLLDSDRMFRNDLSPVAVTDELFTQNAPQESTSAAGSSFRQSGTTNADFPSNASGNVSAHSDGKPGIRQVIVFYDDGTCENFRTRD